MARIEFLVRFYQWALRDALLEMESGFPLISRIHGFHPKSFLWALEDMSTAEREELVRAMVRRFHPAAIDLLGEPLTSRELTILERFRDERMSWQYSSGKGVRVGRLRGLLEGAVSNYLTAGMQRVDLGPRMIGFQVDVGHWSVSTNFDYSKRPFYYQSIDAPQERLETHISIHSWMGISSMTEWDLALAGEEERVVAAMMEASERFLVAVPALLDGLEPST